MVPQNGQMLVSYLLTNGSSLVLQSNPQRRLVPQRIFLLLHPFLALFLNLHVKIPENTRQDGSHFEVCKAKSRGDMLEYAIIDAAQFI